jgi:hypothetical protein
MAEARPWQRQKSPGSSRARPPYQKDHAQGIRCPQESGTVPLARVPSLREKTDSRRTAGMFGTAFGRGTLFHAPPTTAVGGAILEMDAAPPTARYRAGRVNGTPKPVLLDCKPTGSESQE